MSGAIRDETDEDGVRNPRISKRITHAVDLLLSGKVSTQAEAAEQAGLTRSHFNRALKRAHIRAYMTRRSQEMFVGLVPKAVATVARTMDGGNA